MDLQSWRPAVWAAFHAQALTRTWRDVLLTLATFRGRAGRIYPSHATLADRVGCSVTTVQVALRAGREAGLVDWTSGRGRRTSNRYVLLVPREVAPARVVRRVERAVRALVGGWRGGGEQKATKAHNVGLVLPDVASARVALAAVRERRAGERLVLERVKLSSSRHCYSERPQPVQHARARGMISQHVG